MQAGGCAKWRLAATAAAALLTGCGGWSDASPTGTRPHIVVILADDLGYGDVHIYDPDGKIETPHIDRLAREGMRFTDAHSSAAVCHASRYGLLTGRRFARVDKRKLFSQGSSLIAEDRLTMGEFLRRHGYHTGFFGKWHLGIGLPHGAEESRGEFDWTAAVTDGPNDRGFDETFFLDVGAVGGNRGVNAFFRNGIVTEVPRKNARGQLFAESYRSADAMPRTTEAVLDYIDWNVRERPGEPFFVYHAPTAIHLPFTPSAKFVGTSQVGPYGDSVAELDDAVGQVMAKLTEHGLRDDTLVVFTSDNGAQIRLGGRLGAAGTVTDTYGHRPNGRLKGYKGWSTEGGHRVPFIASWPGRIEPGTTCDELVLLDDLMATFAAILGEELPANAAEDSLDLLPLLEGKQRGKPIREYAVINTFYGDPVIRKGKWVLAFHLGSGDQFAPRLEPTPGGPQGQLWDLEADPGQEHDLWLERPDIVAELTALYEADVARGRYGTPDR